MKEGKRRRNIRLIANPVAGREAMAKIHLAQSCLASRGDHVELYLTGARGDAARAAASAREEKVDLVVAAGGDGTLNEVINGLVPSAIPLAFIPLGTTNVFALEAGIPFDVAGACRVALEGKATPVCLGAAGETRFLLMAGLGFDAEVVHRVDLKLKRMLGKGAYLLSAIRIFANHPPAPLEVKCEDGRVLQGYGAIVSNGRYYGGKFSLTPKASLTENSLDVCLLSRPGRWSLLHCLVRMGLRLSLEPAGAVLFKTSEVSVTGEKVFVQIDGDAHGQLPMTFRACPGELVMVLPAGM